MVRRFLNVSAVVLMVLMLAGVAVAEETKPAEEAKTAGETKRGGMCNF